MMPVVSTPPPSGARETRETAALRAVAEAQPDLSAAVALELDLLDHERRLRQRLTTPWVATSEADLRDRLAAGHRLVEWPEVPVDWPDVRLAMRQVVDILRRHDVLDSAQADRLQTVARGPDLETTVWHWYDHVPGVQPPSGMDAPRDPSVDDVVGISLRPVLTRMADVLRQRLGTDTWRRGCCPVCGAAPVFAVLLSGGDRQLVCGRCLMQWAFESLACPFCGTDDRAQLAAFTMPDSPYRLAACRVCRRYVKALDARAAGRPLAWPADQVATLPLDAAAAQQGLRDG